MIINGITYILAPVINPARPCTGCAFFGNCHNIDEIADDCGTDKIWVEDYE